jgi:glycerol uptake facilitator-like aquaporin
MRHHDRVNDHPAPQRAVTAVPLARRLFAELLGTGLLVAVVVGSGIAAQRLSPDDIGLQLLQNSTATVLGLGVLILVLAPVSGAHLNPVVTIADWWLGRGTTGGFSAGHVVPYVAAQVIGGVMGAVLANVMFDVPQGLATQQRASGPHLVAEVVATAGLVLVIFGLARTGRAVLAAPAVGAYIGAAYWFTSSTSFANPAVTAGRVFSDSFAGIAASSVGAFTLAQVLGGIVGVAVVLILFPREPSHD